MLYYNSSHEYHKAIPSISVCTPAAAAAAAVASKWETRKYLGATSAIADTFKRCNYTWIIIGVMLLAIEFTNCLRRSNIFSLSVLSRPSFLLPFLHHRLCLTASEVAGSNFNQSQRVAIAFCWNVFAQEAEEESNRTTEWVNRFDWSVNDSIFVNWWSESAPQQREIPCRLIFRLTI